MAHSCERPTVSTSPCRSTLFTSRRSRRMIRRGLDSAPWRSISNSGERAGGGKPATVAPHLSDSLDSLETHYRPAQAPGIRAGERGVSAGPGGGPGDWLNAPAPVDPCPWWPICTVASPRRAPQSVCQQRSSEPRQLGRAAPRSFRHCSPGAVPRKDRLLVRYWWLLRVPGLFLQAFWQTPYCLPSIH